VPAPAVINIAMAGPDRDSGRHRRFGPVLALRHQATLAVLVGRAALVLCVLAALGAAVPSLAHGDPGPCGGTCPTPPPPPSNPRGDRVGCDDCSPPKRKLVTVYRSTYAYSTPYLDAARRQPIKAASYVATCEAYSSSAGRYGTRWWSRLSSGVWVNNGDLRGGVKMGIGDCAAPPNDHGSTGNPRGQGCDCGPESQTDKLYGVKHLSGRRKKVVDFMERYAREKDVEAYKRKYGWAGPDCTHFASEALLWAGWPEVDGGHQGGHDRKTLMDPDQWWRVNEGTPIKAGSADPFFGRSKRNATLTFTVAEFLFQYLKGREVSGQVHRVADARALDYGDLMQVDEDGDGLMNHTVVVTSFDADGWPKYSQHSNNKADEPLLNGLRKRGYRWFYWHLDDLDR